LIAIAALGFAVTSCTKRPDAAAARPSAPRAASSNGAPQQAPEVVLYDADGHLLPSRTLYMGFAIPMGFEAAGSVDGRFKYRSTSVPYEKLSNYVESRIESSTLETAGRAGLVYRRAQVRGAEDTERRMDISVLTVPGSVELWLRDLAPVVFPPGVTSATRVRDVNRAWQDERE
jgi:hypothetical protein